MKHLLQYAGPLLAMLSAATVSTAMAQSTGPAGSEDETQLQEVIVTSQRRAESLEKTSLVLDVIQPRALSNAGVTSGLQLTTVLPSIQIGSSGPNLSIYVRGVGSYASTAGQGPAVPFYIDGVYISRSQSVPSEFYDVARIEALKGPQGTLYGRNASGGAINVITNNPELGRYTGFVELEGGNYSDRTGEGAINIPIGDTLAVRASGQVVDKGGYTSEDYGDDKHQSGRVKLLWAPSSDVSLLINGSGGHVGGKGPAEAVLNKSLPGWYPWLDVTSPQVRSVYNGSFLNTLIGPGTVVPSLPGDRKMDMDFYNLSAELNWSLGANTLTIVPSYRHARMQYATAVGYTDRFGYNVGDIPSRPETSNQTSLETRLAGSHGPFGYVGGLYFFNENQYQQFTVNGGAVLNSGFVTAYGTRSYAAFGQANYSITDHIRAIAGLRYTTDKRTISGTAYNVSPQLFCTTPDPCVVDAYAGRKDFSNVSWKGGFEADVLRDSLLYATVSRGFKAGGFNTQSSGGADGAFNPLTPGIPGKARLFQPELLTAYELGLKNRLLDNRLQLNVGAFYWDYKNHQEPVLAQTATGSVNLIYANAGAERMYGANFGILAKPWQGGTLSASAEYNNAKYTNFVLNVPTPYFNSDYTGCIHQPAGDGTTNIDCSGFPVARAPRWTGSSGITQEVMLWGGRLSGTVSATYASDRWLSTEFTPIEHAAGYVTADAALTFQSSDTHWTMTGFVRNFNNGRNYTFTYYNSFTGIYPANIGPPRTYGGRLAYRF